MLSDSERRAAERLRSERRRRAAGAVPRAEWLQRAARNAVRNEQVARCLILQYGMSARRAARTIGVSRRQVGRWRRGWPAPAMTAEVAAYHAEQRELEREAMRRGGAVLCWTRCRTHAPRRDILRGFALALATNEQVMKRTVADVAAAVGVHRVTVHRWFQHDRRARRRMVHARRRRTLNRELLRGLAALYRVPVPVLTSGC